MLGHFAEAYKSPEHYNRAEPKKEIKSSSDRAEKYGSKLQQACQTGISINSLSSRPYLVECDCICSQPTASTSPSSAHPHLFQATCALWVNSATAVQCSLSNCQISIFCLIYADFTLVRPSPHLHKGF